MMEPADILQAQPAAEVAPREGVGRDFVPFEETLICPGCNRPLQMMLQPVHTTIQIRCPRCVRQLTPLIRRAIRERQLQS